MAAEMASGEMIGAIAMTEPGAGSDLQGIKTTAKKDGNHYVINGSKTFITNGQHANLIIVVTKTDPDQGRQGHLADGGRDRRGAKVSGAAAISTRSGSRANDTSELFFDDVSIPTAPCSARKKARASPS
jgi:acyl-CoA dehydrogenase